MKLDPNKSRFMGYLSMFTFFMLILIYSDNFVLFFFGWEGIGLSSYLLVGFWFTRIQANKSALKALFVNRIGDFFLILAIMYIYMLFGSVDFLLIFTFVPFYKTSFFYLFGYKINLIFFISLLLFLAAVGKSAQIFLHTWLPDAMEGPTPVSALIHAATMVTAGIFLILRTSFIFQYAGSEINYVLMIFGFLTTLVSSLIGCVQFDIKKIIAYSTCSQLGYMVLACSVSEYAGALFHLVNHAFFKALLFLAAGSVIHSLSNEQDIRKMGALINVLPLTYVVFVIGSLSLSGFPFFSGFYSKDYILLVIYYSLNFKNLFGYWLIVFCGFLTCFYSYRLLYYVFLTRPNGFKILYFNIKEDSNFFFIFPLFLLSILSVISGFFLEDIFIGSGSYFFDYCLKVLPINNKIDAEFLTPIYVKVFPTIISIFSFFFFDSFFNLINKVFIFSENKFSNKRSNSFVYLFYNRFYLFLREKAYFNYIYNELFSKNYSYVSNLFFKVVDTNFLEIFGANKLNYFTHFVSYNLYIYNKKYLFYNFTFFVIFFLQVLILFFMQ